MNRHRNHFPGTVESVLVRNYNRMDGRASRREFWIYILYLVLLVIPLAIMWRDGLVRYSVIGLAVYCAAFASPTISVTIRRVRDSGCGRTAALRVLNAMVVGLFLMVLALGMCVETTQKLFLVAGGTITGGALLTLLCFLLRPSRM